MGTIGIDYNGGMSFKVSARDHSLSVDLANEKGGQDSGMNPPEVFIASLGTCIGVYVVKYLQNVKLDAANLKITLSWKFSEDKTQIASIDVILAGLGADIGKRKNAVLEAAKHCLIHKTLLSHPDINISLI